MKHLMKSTIWVSNSLEELRLEIKPFSSLIFFFYSSASTFVTYCLSSGCCNKVSQMGWLINNRNLFLTIPESRSPDEGTSCSGSGEGHLLGCRWPPPFCILTRQRAERKQALLTLIRTPFMGLHSHDLI